LKTLMSAFNSYLLSVFTNHQRFGSDTGSLNKRLQTLSIIYVNLGTDSCLILFNLMIWLFFPHASPLIMPLACFPFSICSYIALRNHKLDLAATILLVKVHLSNIIASQATNFPIAALYGTMIYPTMTMFLTPVMKLHVFNMVLCFLECILNSYDLMEIFKVTLTDEQYRQVIALIITSFNCVFTICCVIMMQKRIESNIWKIAYDNQQKSENLTKEVVQAMEAKDMFVSMLSHEIRNPLNSLRGSVDYLIQVVKNSDHLQILHNAKLSGEILLNLISNVLDAAKLKSDKMELICTETNLPETVAKVFTINSENFKDKNLAVEAFIDRGVPKLLWMDSSRLLQILMNLISNAIKFTPKNGSIKIFGAWYDLDEDKEKLLMPFTEDRRIKFDTSLFIQHKRKEAANSKVEEEVASLNALEDSIAFMQELDESEKSNFSRNLQTVSAFEAKFITNLNSSPRIGSIKNQQWTVFHRFPTYNDLRIQSSKSDTTGQGERPPSQGYLKLQVLDTGSGISKEDIPKLFGMFEQATQHSRSVQGGTGLGLWICKQLIQKMGGNIALYSKVNEGTSFVFYVPINNDKVTRFNSVNVISRTRRIRAMVVDDHSVNRYLHKLLLEQEGVIVNVATNGLEAVEKYKNQDDDGYDVILMDVQMPVMDGFTAAKKIREWETENKKAPANIFFITGEYLNETEVLTGFKSRGGTDNRVRCLRKPIDVNVIKNALSILKNS